METNWSKIIERYLQGELSADGLEAFEFELGLNPDLRAELDIHKLIHESLYRSAERLAIQNIGKKYHFKAKLKKWLSFTSVVTATAVTIALVAMNSRGDKADNTSDIDSATTEIINDASVDDTTAVAATHDIGRDKPQSEFAETAITDVPRRTSERFITLNDLDKTVDIQNPTVGKVVGGVSPNSSSSNGDQAASSLPKEKPKEKPKEPEKELPKVLEDKKLRFLMSKGVLNPADIKTEEVQKNFPTGDHLTLGNFKVYSSSEGIILHNFITDDVIVLGKTPADQIKNLTEKNKYKAKPATEDSEPKSGNIYLQNY